MKNRYPTILLLILTTIFMGCSGKHLNVKRDNTLALSSCFPLPNCVSSSSWMIYNTVTPYELAIPADEAWPMVKDILRDIPRTEIVEETPVYIHAKCRSRVFRFVDNLELLLNEDGGTISVRSASVIGLFDFGANHWRVMKLRKALFEKGIIKQVVTPG